MYRPCPSFPGYSVSLAGEVLREEYSRITKTGKTVVVPAKVLSHVGRGRAYVLLGTSFVRWDMMRNETWDVDERAAGVLRYDPFNPLGGPRPQSDFPGGRVITVDEWRAELSRKD